MLNWGKAGHGGGKHVPCESLAFTEAFISSTRLSTWALALRRAGAMGKTWVKATSGEVWFHVVPIRADASTMS